MAHSFSRNFILKKLSENKVIRSYINNSLAIRGASFFIPFLVALKK